MGWGRREMESALTEGSSIREGIERFPGWSKPELLLYPWSDSCAGLREKGHVHAGGEER